MKFIKLFLFTLFFFILISYKTSSIHSASSNTDIIDITIPSELAIQFHADGSNSFSEFKIQNNMNVPISIDTIDLSLKNEWKVMPQGTSFGLNKKELSLIIEDIYLVNGSNPLSLKISENSSTTLDIKAKRGVYTESNEKESVFELTFNYEVLQKDFDLILNTPNANNGNSTTITAKNGETITLPEPLKSGYTFSKWIDEDGNEYLANSNYTMPIGGSTLTAKWNPLSTSLITGSQFKTSIPSTATSIVFTYERAPENATLTDLTVNQDEGIVAWLDETTYKISTQRKESKISFNPDSSGMFQSLTKLTNIDLTHVDTSSVTSMANMFDYTGSGASSFEIVGLNSWDVSNVNNMSYMFRNMGRSSQSVSIGNLSNWNVSSVLNMNNMFHYAAYNASTFEISGLDGWNVSNVTKMAYMFAYTGYKATYTIDCSKWTVSNVTTHANFNTGVTSKVLTPTW